MGEKGILKQQDHTDCGRFMPREGCRNQKKEQTLVFHLTSIPGPFLTEGHGKQVCMTYSVCIFYLVAHIMNSCESNVDNDGMLFEELNM